MKKEKQQIALISLIVCLFFVVLASAVMKFNSGSMTEKIELLNKLRKFDANPDNAGYAWDSDTNLPVGFDAKDSGSMFFKNYFSFFKHI